jgi:transcriptional regulator with XRE-family HTH domain
MKERGWRLRAARAERGLTEDALAAEMRHWAELHGAARPEITANTIAEWEGGVRPMDGAALRLLWLALEVPTRSRADVDVDVWSLFRPRRRDANDRTRRREFLEYAASLGEPVALDPDRLDAVIDETARVDRRVVESLGFVARRFMRRWGTEPPQAFRRQLHAHLEVVLALLDHPLGGDQRRELEAAAATTATFAGFVSILVGRPDPAAVYLEIAHRLASSAADAEAEAMALLASSQLYSLVCPARATGDPATAQALLEAADRRLARRTAPVANAWVLLREAEELAATDELGALRLADEADRLTVGAGGIPADGMCSRWSMDLHVAYRGNISVLAGHPERGIPLLEAALAALPRELVATRPMATADLGGAYAAQGEIDHACALLGQALDQAVAAGLPDPVLRVRRVRERRLAGLGSVAAVRELDERLRAAPVP